MVVHEKIMACSKGCNFIVVSGTRDGRLSIGSNVTKVIANISLQIN